MKLLADECCDSALVSFLRKEGHDVLYVTEYRPGALDSEVVEIARIEKRIIITEYKDRLKKHLVVVTKERFRFRPL